MENKKEVIFADGLFFKKPHEKAPDFIKGNISIKVDEFIQFLTKHKNEAGYVNLNLKKSKGGKLYVDLDTWERGQTKGNLGDKPEALKEEEVIEYPEEDIKSSDIPF